MLEGSGGLRFAQEFGPRRSPWQVQPLLVDQASRCLFWYPSKLYPPSLVVLFKRASPMAMAVLKPEVEAEKVRQLSVAAEQVEEPALLTGPFVKQVDSSTA